MYTNTVAMHVALKGLNLWLDTGDNCCLPRVQCYEEVIDIRNEWSAVVIENSFFDAQHIVCYFTIMYARVSIYSYYFMQYTVHVKSETSTTNKTTCQLHNKQHKQINTTTPHSTTNKTTTHQLHNKQHTQHTSTTQHNL